MILIITSFFFLSHYFPLFFSPLFLLLFPPLSTIFSPDSYAEDKWDDSPQEMLINVDELSRKRHSRLVGYQTRLTEADLSYFMEFKRPDPAEGSTSPTPPSPPRSIGAGPSKRPGMYHSYARDLPSAPLTSSSTSPQPLRRTDVDDELMRMDVIEDYSAARDELVDDEDNDDVLANFSLFTIFLEILLFVRWCLGMTFVNPATFNL